MCHENKGCDNEPQLSGECGQVVFRVVRGFDDVEVFDSGSVPEKVPKSMSRSFRNIYWTGLWEEVRKTCYDYDAVWVLGGDVELRSDPMLYRKSIEN